MRNFIQTMGSWVTIVLIAASIQLSPSLANEQAAKGEQPPDLPAWMPELEKAIDGLPAPSDSWLKIMVRIHEAGETSVPELIAAMDATSNDAMIRALAFLMRASGDKRCVPALIRAIPKTLRPPGSDYGLQAKEANCIAFAQAHQLGEKREGDRFDFGRPVREVFGALQSLTSQNHGEEELYHMFLEGTSNQRRQKHQIYYRCAMRWSRWWSSESSKLGVDAAYQAVQLPPAKEIAIVEMTTDTPLTLSDSHSGWSLAPVQRMDSEVVFLDLDTGRTSNLPERWRKEEVENHLEAIYEWAMEEGLDLMGSQTPGDKEPVFILQPIHLNLWELPSSYWKQDISNTTLETLRKELTLTDVLMHFDATQQKYDPQACGTFLYETRDGTSGILYSRCPHHQQQTARGCPYPG